MHEEQSVDHLDLHGGLCLDQHDLAPVVSRSATALWHRSAVPNVGRHRIDAASTA